ncbi:MULTISPECIES: helix-turn-helix domain-containing protein [unclassified Hyphomonas]|jgi:DNA-binding HxlR family transcriptional regulator|uniref:winged helix-turn-helix transcriptional regulator n=1 Tax=unclassified Hyphomonas TaxID=2630699 RepID=UPI000458C487|nr:MULTISPECIES: helix-turn-helix domain-containing protein [unclassified Hyphomonas]KCZ47894.1 hypothetical protein HY17_05285 [Hyphomonas sp. CY54-11-8]RAN41156.1 hypothetical protein HY26_09790 [Hyphomonas sp. GM-8P]
MTASYKQFCPVAMASEILCTRWTIVLLRELLAGSTRFNELRKGVPRMSPSLLSRRLTELEAAGIVRQVVEDERGTPEYQLTEPGRDLRPVIESIGIWGQRWVDADLSLDNLDPSLLMWDMRRNLDASPLPDERSVIQFIYSDLPLSQKNWWLIVEPDGMVDLCSVDPGFEIDLYVTTDLRPMTAIWMGLSTVKAERKNGALDLIGDQELSRHMQTWLGLSPFAVEPKRV